MDKWGADLQVRSCLPMRVMRTARRTMAMIIELELPLGVRSRSSSSQRRTYKPPRRNTASTLIFFFFDIWSWRTALTGSARMSASRMMLGTWMPMKKSKKLMHRPGISASHAFRTGMHWKAPSRLFTTNQARTRIAKTMIRRRKGAVEKTRR